MIVTTLSSFSTKGLLQPHPDPILDAKAIHLPLQPLHIPTLGTLFPIPFVPISVPTCTCTHLIPSLFILIPHLPQVSPTLILNFTLNSAPNPTHIPSSPGPNCDMPCDPTHKEAPRPNVPRHHPVSCPWG